VPQKRNEKNQWYKAILMEHVEIEHLPLSVQELKQEVNAL
jgi:tyrosine decarboxylase/aspartate 1-decarboxylase